jgi:tRNA-specific 2-thiouridylase
VKTRSSAKHAAAIVAPAPDGVARVEFEQPQLDLTAGQAAVFYRGDVVLGGGVIV